MKKKNIVLIISMLFACLGVLAQQKTEGYVILVEGDKVYVDFTEKDVTVGSMLEVAGKEEYMVHPVTGEKIRKEAGGVDLLKAQLYIPTTARLCLSIPTRWHHQCVPA